MATIELKNLVKEYADGVAAVNDLSVDIADGELMILAGPSGSGKSTVLRMIVGLEAPTSGDLLIDGRRVNDLAPGQRDLAMVFQDYALYPHLSVYENIAFPLRLTKAFTRSEVDERVRGAAKTLGLDEHLDRRPADLSGGQRQRVAMGRAIVREAKAVLFDEPLSNLDATLRGQMRSEIAQLQRTRGTTIIYVTHDQSEALTLGDRVAVLDAGVLQQCAAPRVLYDYPVNLFVAGFIGTPPMNLVPARVDGDLLELPFAAMRLSEQIRGRIDGREQLIAGIRAEDFADTDLAGGAQKRGVHFSAEVDLIEWLGSEQRAYLAFQAAEEAGTQIVVSLDADSTLRAGGTANLVMDTAKMHLFVPDTGENLTVLTPG